MAVDRHRHPVRPALSMRGIVGAVGGGYLFTLVGAAPVTGSDISSMFVAVIGAIVVRAVSYAVACAALYEAERLTPLTH